MNHYVLDDAGVFSSDGSSDSKDEKSGEVGVSPHNKRRKRPNNVGMSREDGSMRCINQRNNPDMNLLNHLTCTVDIPHGGELSL